MAGHGGELVIDGRGLRAELVRSGTVWLGRGGTGQSWG